MSIKKVATETAERMRGEFPELDPKVVEKVLRAGFESIKDLTEKYGNLRINHFASFSLNEETGRDVLLNGKTYQVKPGMKVMIRPSPSWQQLVKSKNPEDLNGKERGIWWRDSTQS